MLRRWIERYESPGTSAHRCQSSSVALTRAGTKVLDVGIDRMAVQSQVSPVAVRSSPWSFQLPLIFLVLHAVLLGTPDRRCANRSALSLPVLDISTPESS